MGKLLRADLYRIRKGKITIVGLILCAVFPVLIGLMYLGIEKLIGLDSVEGIEATLFNARMLFASGYSSSNNLGIAIPVFSAIFVAADISNGTLRNKIISGASKVSIYLSHLLTSIIFNVIFINIYAIVSLLVNSLLLGYGTAFTADEFLLILRGVGIGTLDFVFLASLTTLLAMTTKNAAPTIIFSVLLSMAFGLLGTLLLFFDVEEYGYLLSMIPMVSFSIFSTLLDETDCWILIIGAASLLVFTVLNTVLGTILFKKSDIK